MRKHEKQRDTVPERPGNGTGCRPEMVLNSRKHIDTVSRPDTITQIGGHCCGDCMVLIYYDIWCRVRLEYRAI